MVTVWLNTFILIPCWSAVSIPQVCLYQNVPHYIMSEMLTQDLASRLRLVLVRSQLCCVWLYMVEYGLVLLLLPEAVHSPVADIGMAMLHLWIYIIITVAHNSTSIYYHICPLPQMYTGNCKVTCSNAKCKILQSQSGRFRKHRYIHNQCFLQILPPRYQK